MSKTILFPREKWVNGGLNTAVDEALQDFEGDTCKEMGRSLFGSPGGLFGLRIVTTRALLHNHNFISEPVCNISQALSVGGQT